LAARRMPVCIAEPLAWDPDEWIAACGAVARGGAADAERACGRARARWWSAVRWAVVAAALRFLVARHAAALILLPLSLMHTAL
jgi:hypothetical protein